MAQEKRHPLLIWLAFLKYMTLICSIFVGACFGMSLYGSASSLASSKGSSITQVWFQLGISFYGLLFALLIFLIVCYFSVDHSHILLLIWPQLKKIINKKIKIVGTKDIMGNGELTIVQALAMAWILLHLHWIVGSCCDTCIWYW